MAVCLPVSRLSLSNWRWEVQGLGFRVYQGLGFRVYQGLGFRVIGFRVYQGLSGFRV